MITFCQENAQGKVEITIKDESLTLYEFINHFKIFCLALEYSTELVEQYFEERLQ